jgi:methionyl-tRNA synthetase
MEAFGQETLIWNEVNWKPILALVILVAWSLAWKGIALWQAARLAHKWWFIAILLVSSLGVLEIIYIFLISSKYKVESKEVK